MQSHSPRVSFVVIDQDHGSLGMHLGRTSQLDSKKDNGPLHPQGMTDSDAAMRLRVRIVENPVWQTAKYNRRIGADQFFHPISHEFFWRNQLDSQEVV